MPHFFHKHTGVAVKVGDRVTSFRGEKATVTGFRDPDGNSSGRVYVEWDDNVHGRVDSRGEYFPSVFDLEWSEGTANG